MTKPLDPTFPSISLSFAIITSNGVSNKTNEMLFLLHFITFYFIYLDF